MVMQRNAWADMEVEAGAVLGMGAGVDSAQNTSEQFPGRAARRRGQKRRVGRRCAAKVHCDFNETQCVAATQDGWNASADMMDNEVVPAAVQQDNYSLKNASANTKSNEKVVMTAVQNKGSNATMHVRENANGGNDSGNSSKWWKRMPSLMDKRESPTQKVYAYDGTLPVVETESHCTSGSPAALIDSQERCNEVIRRLEEGDQIERLSVLLWFHKTTRQLALSKTGCRVVQTAMEKTNGPDRDLLITELKDHIVELYESPHGNHVLSRTIEVLPAAKTAFVIAPLVGRGVAAAKHRFGCRVLCRLMEHCTDVAEMGNLLDEVLAQADSLARHAYGNFVVQTALEHITPARRSAVFLQLLPGFATLAMHRYGSLVAQRALDYCDADAQNMALEALLQAEGENSIVETARSHYGSYVIEQLAMLRHARRQDITNILASNLDYLSTSQHAKRVIIAFGLDTAEQRE